MTRWVCERCRTILAVGLSRCPHCSQPPEGMHEFGSRPEDFDHPMMGRLPDMAKITRQGGATDATMPEPDTEPTTGAPEPAPEPVKADPNPLERPGSKANRQTWLDWAAVAGYHVPCVAPLTIPQIQALPDGPPVYDDEGLLVAPEGSSDETAAAVDLYNITAIDLYEAGDVEPEGEPEDEPAPEV